jgi:hypothetical protein
MSRAPSLLIVASLSLFAFGVTSAMAASGSERECEATPGATYVKDGPDSICVGPVTTKDVKGNAFGTATQNTSTGHGNLDNKTVGPVCEGNQGQCKQQ